MPRPGASRLTVATAGFPWMKTSGGRSVEAAELEDPWLEPPADAFAWTRPSEDTPQEPAYLEIHFERESPSA